MWIKSYRETGNYIANSDFVISLNTAYDKSSNRYKVMLEHSKPHQGAYPIALYNLKSTADSSIDRFYEALEDGLDVFEFPLDGDPSLSYADGRIRQSPTGRAGKKTGKTK